MTQNNAIPEWASESVHVESYDKAWVSLAQQYNDELSEPMSQWLLKPIEHVGSTAIPCVSAKPIIDLMALVADLEVATQQMTPDLLTLGWHLVPPELDERPWRRFYVKVSADQKHRLAHLHVMQVGTARWDEQLQFRDALRASDELRIKYGALKGVLAKQYANDREGYTAAKAEFIQGVLGTDPVPKASA